MDKVTQTKIKKGLKRLSNVLYPLVAFGFIIAVWAIAAAAVGVTLILPTPAEALSKLWLLLGTAESWSALGLTVLRALRSFLYAVALAAVLAVLAVRSPVFRKLAEPIVSVLRSVPTMSIVLIVILWLGSKYSPILIAFLITFPLLYNNFLEALSTIDRGIVEMSKVYKVPATTRLVKLYLPAVSGDFLSAMKGAISLSLKVTIASEVMAQTRQSLGLAMQRAMVTLEMAELIAWTVAAIVVSYLLELLVEGVKRLIVRWN